MEILTTEEAYARNLSVLLSVYVQSVKTQAEELRLTPANVKALTLNVAELRAMAYSLLNKLRPAVASQGVEETDSPDTSTSPRATRITRTRCRRHRGGLHEGTTPAAILMVIIPADRPFP